MAKRRFNPMSQWEWKRMRDKRDAFIVKLEQAGYFSEHPVAMEQERGLFSELYELLYKKEPLDALNTHWIHFVDDFSRLSSFMFELAVTEMSLDERISVARQEFALQLLGESDEIDLEFKPREAHCDYVGKLLRFSRQRKAIAVIPICYNLGNDIHHWGFILIEVTLNTVARESDCSTSGDGLLSWGDSLSFQSSYGALKKLLDVVEAVVKGVFPSVRWKRASANYLCSNDSVMGFASQEDSYSCGFYVLSFLIHHCNLEQSPDFRLVASYKPNYLATITAGLRRACVRITVRATLRVINENGGINHKKVESNLYQYINMRWPFPRMRKERLIPGTIDISKDSAIQIIPAHGTSEEERVSLGFDVSGKNGDVENNSEVGLIDLFGTGGTLDAGESQKYTLEAGVGPSFPPASLTPILLSSQINGDQPFVPLSKSPEKALQIHPLSQAQSSHVRRVSLSQMQPLQLPPSIADLPNNPFWSSQESAQLAPSDVQTAGMVASEEEAKEQLAPRRNYSVFRHEEEEVGEDENVVKAEVPCSTDFDKKGPSNEEPSNDKRTLLQKERRRGRSKTEERMVRLCDIAEGMSVAEYAAGSARQGYYFTKTYIRRNESSTKAHDIKVRFRCLRNGNPKSGFAPCRAIIICQRLRQRSSSELHKWEVWAPADNQNCEHNHEPELNHPRFTYDSKLREFSCEKEIRPHV